MPIDSYPSWVARVRKDPLGPQGYNRLRAGFSWVDALLGKEHIRQSHSYLSVGEHNAAEVAREVGSVYMTVGPVANKEGFRHMASVSRTALGDVQMTLKSDIYNVLEQMSVQVTNMSEQGINIPCISTANIVSTTRVDVHSKRLTSALGAGNVWAAEDADYAAAIRGQPLHAGPALPPGIGKQRGNTMTDSSGDWNGMVAVDAELRMAFRVEHSATGVHTNREVARTWAHIGVRSGGGVFEMLGTSTRNPLSVSRPGLGICRLTATTAWALSAQPFVKADYQRSNGGAIGDIYVICAPRSLVTTTTVDFYTYKYDAGANTWGRADTDLYCVVHGG